MGETMKSYLPTLSAYDNSIDNDNKNNCNIDSDNNEEWGLVDSNFALY